MAPTCPGIGTARDPKPFATLAAANRELRLDRTTIGELIVALSTGSEPGNCNLKLSYFLARWIEEEGGLVWLLTFEWV